MVTASPLEQPYEPHNFRDRLPGLVLPHWEMSQLYTFTFHPGASPPSPVPVTEAGKAQLWEQEANRSQFPPGRKERERTRSGTELNVLKAPHAVTTSFCKAPPPTGSTASPNNATDHGPTVKQKTSEEMFLIQTTTLSLMILLVLICCLFHEEKIPLNICTVHV